MIKNWLYQLILALVLICHSSYRGIVELFRDLFDLPTSIRTIHNRLQETTEKATEINKTQDLSDIEVGLHDEIYQSNRLVLVGVDAASTYCYLLKAVEHRDRLWVCPTCGQHHVRDEAAAWNILQESLRLLPGNPELSP